MPKGTGQVIIGPNLELSLEELSEKLGKSQRNVSLVDAAAKVLNIARPLWQPKVVYRWLDVKTTEENKVSLICGSTGENTTLELGFSIQFIKNAQKALVGVYTAGKELEDAALAASGRGQVLDAYLFDIVGLAVLEKLGQQLNRVVESYAGEHGWGVSPLLSPGSVHGWELEDQHNLFYLLPLNAIGVVLSSSGILQPFKSLSFLIGTGPGYQATEVGKSCVVCSKRNDCVMRISS